MKKIIIFASGSGTNAENIIKYFQNKKNAVVTHVFSNKLGAKVLKRAHDLKVKALHFDRESFYDTNEVLHILKDANPDLIVLAGFLWIFPKKIIDAFPDKVINIHPALLPKYGGKGMYGSRVHEAIIQNGEKESGITIHYVNENYDEGAVIFQAKTEIKESFTPEDLAKAIHNLEYKHFPPVIEKVLGLESK
ncbi:phosphoribosylglycinamide formyltransferase [Aquimarina brevivitae]|uniref:Phosphoribosylglycinamide formyltransferase n=1 Tax=Aquimarina brevivitae TaxID=323412 RepID=A0A4Q7PGB2_9FLAO|nr:phosphoribosylglycinamide formyltransferase [Aquimarina brevivitae]RZS99536.1 formyltetrahydrofolate-dependent phosphoribosylglycinamide formyltransferase [Aquimarina brevivitae]